MVAEAKGVGLKLIDRAADCTIAVFMTCLFDGKLQALIIEGEPTQQQLEEAFDKIVVEYSDMSGLSDKTELHLIKEIERYKIKVAAISIVLEVEKRSIDLFNEPIIEGFPVLKKHGYSIKWKEGEPIDLLKTQLKNIGVRAITDHVHLEELQHDLSEFNKDRAAKVNKVKNTRKEFIELLVLLPKHGFVINRNVTTMEEFAIMLEQFYSSVKVK